MMFDALRFNRDMMWFVVVVVVVGKHLDIRYQNQYEAKIKAAHINSHQLHSHTPPMINRTEFYWINLIGVSE